jgi:hypothetical protein
MAYNWIWSGWNRISDELVLEGLWWRPEKPEEKSQGFLRYGLDETVELTLKQAWHFDDQPVKMLSFPMIFGKLKDGNELTLIDCTALQTEPETLPVQYSISSVLQGSQLCKGETDHTEKDYAHFLQFPSLIKKF